MSILQKIQNNSYCVGDRHYSGTNNKKGFITAKGIKMLECNCTKFKSVGKATVNFGKKVANNLV